MDTVFDALSIILFAGLVLLFIKRSVGIHEQESIDSSQPKDHLWQYLLAGTGCALSDIAGNHGYSILAVFLLTATLSFSFLVLHPFADFGPKKP